MSKPTSKSRRWRNAVLVILLAIAGGCIAWVFRPLTETEHALLGTWNAPWGEIIFQANRRYLLTEGVPATGPASGGFWSARSNRISICPDINTPLRWNTLLIHARALLSSAGRTGTGAVIFAEPDRLQLVPDDAYTRPEKWNRVREQHSESAPRAVVRVSPL